MMSFAIIVPFLSSAVEAVSWQGVRNNLPVGVTLNITSGSFNDVTFTLPRGAIVWTTSQAQVNVLERVRGIINLNSPEYAYLDQQVAEGRNKNRDKRPVVSIGVTGYSIAWETAEQFNTNVVMPQ